jgi:hypothetical protein
LKKTATRKRVRFKREQKRKIERVYPIRFTADEWAALVKRAKRSQESIAGVIRNALDEHMGKL